MDLLTAARAWRASIIPNSSTAPYDTHRALVEAINALDSQEIPSAMAYFDSDQHALAAGWFAGMLLGAKIKFHFVMDDDGNYTPKMVVLLDMDDSGHPVHLPIVLEPPQT